MSKTQVLNFKLIKKKSSMNLSDICDKHYNKRWNKTQYVSKKSRVRYSVADVAHSTSWLVVTFKPVRGAEVFVPKRDFLENRIC